MSNIKLLNNKRKIEALYYKILHGKPQVKLNLLTKECIEKYKLSQRIEYETVEKKFKSSNENEFAHENLDISKEPLKLIKSTNFENKDLKNDMNMEKNKDQKCDDDNGLNYNVQYTNSSNTKIKEEKRDQDSGMQYMLTKDETSENLSNKSLKVEEYSKIGKISLCKWSKLSDPDLNENNCEESSSITTEDEKIPENKTPISYQIKKDEKLSLAEIECLYQKYFTKSIQDNTIIITNILYLISLFNKQYKTKMDESLKIKSETEKYKVRSETSKIYEIHKEILESKLNEYFLEVIYQFPILEFETLFKMFFLCIFTELKNQKPNFKKSSLFKNLTLLLLNTIKHNKPNHVENAFALLKYSNTFRNDCHNLMHLIEEGQESDPGIVDRLPKFFVSSLNNQKYFQEVINAVTNDVIVNLKGLIDNCITAFLCSTFESSKDLLLSSTAKKNTKLKSSISASKCMPENNCSFQKLILEKYPNITIRPVSKIDSKPEKKYHRSLENGKTRQQLNSLDKSLSNSSARVSTKNNMVCPKSAIRKPENIPLKLTVRSKTEVPLRIFVLKKIFNASKQSNTTFKSHP